MQIAAKGFGYRVIGIDHGSKKDLVLKSGAEHFIDHTTEKDVVEKVKELSDGLGVHAVVVLTAANAAYATTVPMLRFAGVVVLVGIPEGDLQPIASAAPGPMIALEKRIVGSAVGTRKQAIDTLDMARRGIIKSHHKIAKMDDLQNIFHDMHGGKLQYVSCCVHHRPLS